MRRMFEYVTYQSKEDTAVVAAASALEAAVGADSPLFRDPAKDAFLKHASDAALQDEETCAVCLDDFAADPRHLDLVCTHNFHAECLYDWLAKSDACPMCRQTMARATPQ